MGGKRDWELDENDIQIDLDNKIKHEEIAHLIKFEFANRLIIRTKKGEDYVYFSIKSMDLTLRLKILV